MRGAVHDSWTSTALQHIDFPGGRAYASDRIERFTQVVGEYIADNAEHGFLYSGGVYTAIDHPDAPGTAAPASNQPATS